MTFATADLCDVHSATLQITEPGYQSFGANTVFSGPIATVKAFEDNSFVRKALEEPGCGRVLVVDGGGSRRCALVGDQLAKLARENGWAGIVVNGCIRDSAEISTVEIGLKALATHPLKSQKRNEGQRDVPVSFAGVTFLPGHYVYADADGIVVSDVALKG